MGAIFIWILKSLLILVIFHFLVPPVVNALTRNSWAKLPFILVVAIAAGAFMAWLKYVPFLLFFLWLILNKYTLEAMTERKFETEANMKISKPLFYASWYLYIVLSCLLGWFFQVEVVSADDPTGGSILLWKRLLGLE